MNKNLLLSLLMLVFTTSLFAQQLQPESAVFINDLGSTKMVKTVTCGIDTNGYLLSKATGINALSINNVTSARGFSQYFDCPQDLSISGVNFYAYGTSVPSTPITVNLYYANPADSMPTGSLLATVTVNVDSVFGGGILSNLKRTAIFPSPVTVNAPYCIEITNYSGNNVAFMCSDWQVSDGGNEWLSGIDIGGTYLRSYSVNVGGFPYNADFLVDPYVTYDFTAGVDDPTVFSCYNTSSNIMFSEKHPLVENRMYSLAALYGLTDTYYGWDFGDGSPTVSADTTYHTYGSYGNYTVTHTDTLFGWTNTCIDTTSFIITLDTINAIGGWLPDGLDVDYYDFSTTNSPGGITGWLWDFGDGNTSTSQFTSHTYASSGTYTVCLIASNACVADTTCAILTVTCNAPVADFTDSTNNLFVSFTNLSTSDDVFPFYLWDFGDGNTSTQTNPTHTYASPGVYTVCLTISDSCGTDSSCATVTVTCLSPNAAFSAGINNLSVNFTDMSSNSPSSWMWDFGDGNTSIMQHPTHTYAAAGTYTVCLLVSNSCGMDTVCSPVTVAPCTPPVAAFFDSTYNLTAAFYNLSTSSYGSPFYFWDFGDGNTSTQQDPMHTYAASGTYTVCLIVTDSCGSDSTCSNVTVTSTVGISDFENNIQVYPNPVNEVLNIDLSTEAIGKLYAADGRLVKQIILVSGLNNIDVSEFESGVYTLSIENDIATKSYQIIIK